MQFEIKTQGLQTVAKHLAKLSSTEFREAVAQAMTDTAFQVRREMQAEIGRQFDRATPYIMRSVQVKRATATDLVADIARTITLVPGDILFSGTPAFSRTVYPGDVVEVEVEGLGTLRNTIVQGPVPIRDDCGAQPSESAPGWRSWCWRSRARRGWTRSR